MTQEQKDLLFKDLCCRLPYGVKVQCGDYLFTFDKDHMGIGMLYNDFDGNPLESPKIILSGCYYGEDIKPYLFPLSSMTEEQRKELYKMGWYLDEDKIYSCFRNYDDANYKTHPDCFELVNWCYKNNFDINGLIPTGLAKDSTGLNIY